MLPDFPQLPRRVGGVLFHPTSLPGPFGIGDLGPEASAWLSWLYSTGCALWQILPLGPTGYADSPYQSFSAFAGNHLLVSPQRLREQGLLRADELAGLPDYPEDQVAYGDVIPWKESLLDGVAFNFKQRAAKSDRQAFDQYCEEQSSWLEDFALFMALKREHGGKPWPSWEPSLRDRQATALQAARASLHMEINAQRVRQYLIQTQWLELKSKAEALGLAILGDMPIFVAHDSADVWANPGLFQLDHFGQPTVVAGVPPDYFSATGQRWGNPLYDWERLAELDYDWWIARFKIALSYVDVIRLDHFRGFEAYWEIPNSETTAINGRWVPGPGRALLDRLQEALEGLPLIAEDLGVITEEVTSLRKAYNLPGMKVMQFGLEAGPGDDFLPHMYEEGCVAYTGTHDNDTTVGWYRAASDEIRQFTLDYLDTQGEHIAWDLIESVWSSAASWAIVPLQDLLELGSDARMNFPSHTHGNWKWRVRNAHLTPDLATRILRLNQRSNRHGHPVLSS